MTGYGSFGHIPAMSSAPQKRDDVLRAQLAVGVAVCLLLVAVAGAVNLNALRASGESRDRLVRSQAILKSIADLRLLYTQVTADIRAYVLTGRNEYRHSYDQGVAALPSALARVRSAAADAPAYRATIDRLGVELDHRREQFTLALQNYAEGGVAAVTALSSNPDIRQSSVSMQDLLTELTTRERAQLAGHVEEDRERQQLVGRWSIVTLVLSVLIVLMLALRVVKEFAAREAAQRETRRQQHFADSVIENLPAMVYIKDARDLTLVRVNRAVEELTGRTRNEMLHKDDRQFFTGDYAARYMESERALIDRSRREPVVEHEEILLDTDQGRRVLAVRKAVLKDEEGEPAYLLGTSIDVTDQRLAEMRLRETSDRLIEQTRALESANRELESFSYSVSHDLRTPLRAVDGYAAILEEDYGPHFDAEGRRYLRAIRDGATRMGALIQDLLSFARLSRQALTPVAQPTRPLVESAWSEVLSAYPEARVRLILGELPATWGDPVLLSHVWTNLLDNAVKYSLKASSPEVRIDGRFDDRDAVFSVRDNGAGFDMRYYGKLFHVFQRLHAETDYPGTGVGLAIVQRIVNRHGGRVWGESTLGAGAQFSFTLPASSQSPR